MAGRIYIINLLIGIFASFQFGACQKKQDSTAPTDPLPPKELQLNTITINGAVSNGSHVQLNSNEVSITVSFSEKLNKQAVVETLSCNTVPASTPVLFSVTLSNGDSALQLKPLSALNYLTQYRISIPDSIKSVNGGKLQTSISLIVRTGIDQSDKFPQLTDEALLDTVQKRTFRYFWDYGHPVSGLARDKTNTTELDDCSIGGTGFGILTIPIAVNRNFITRAEGFARMQKIVGFLKTKAKTFHGTFPHRIHGVTGDVVVWSQKDDGADLVETSFLMMGLLTARQFFNGTNPEETALREAINTLYANVEWNWFRKDNQNALYWLWSPTYQWDITFMIRGWNETLISYILAASSPTHTIAPEVYHNGFANHGGMKNGQQYYGINLPLGEPFGGPLFLSQYSFLCINPLGLTDTYANYETQVKNHTLINRAYCKENPKIHFGYSDSCWGLSASSTNVGYTPCSPTKDIGVIAPTAALSSFAFTPKESMEALKYFYYRLGNYVWKEYGFVDAFSLHTNPVWVGPQELVYNQLPIMIAIENHRSKLVWDLFTSCPEVKAGMKKLGFSAPYL